MEGRLETILGHISAASDSFIQPSCTAAGVKSPDDIVLVSSVRTPIGRGKRGSFKDTSIDDLLAPVLSHILTSTNVPANRIGDVVIGTVLPTGSTGATQVRIAALIAGLPQEVPATTVNRQCSSGLQAIANVAASIRSGYYDIGIAGGVESMSKNAMGWDGDINQKALSHPVASGCYLTMGQTSENVVERFGVTRAEQDALAARSHALAANAIKQGLFKDEIVPVTIETQDKSGNTVQKVIDTDEGVRAGTTVESLGKLPAAFKEGGTTTAGNSSQVSDGAAASLLMKRSTAQSLGLPVLGVLRSFAAVGVEPSIMGIGPAAAIPAAVAQAGIRLADVDLFEINEAFASQAVYCVKHLGLSLDKVNVNGGAIALGHPLGCTGARLTATLLHEMKRRNSRYGVVSMCIGSGMGAAAVYERD
eukprot:TRINITY_DN180_c0_g2_i1.p2 TRINITY_DN180_c0_g2~~TRINITY_DN180_c0_g2_i1.p2  ORF type:complete len:445 (-),score=208.26 TRINITY_DN180_c0_g2_i1:23-1282(-)